MTGPFGAFMPKDESWLVRKVQDLEAKVDRLAAARTLEASTISEGDLTVDGANLNVTGGGSAYITGGGNFVVKDGGNAIVRDGGAFESADPTTSLASLYVGSSINTNAVPSHQMVFQLWRSDGTIAFAMSDSGTSPGHTLKQSLASYDRQGNVVLADDTNGGVGLANPHVAAAGGPVANTNTATWPSTTGAAFTTIADGYWEIQNPKLKWEISLQADASTTGQFQVQINGTTVSTVQTVTGAFSQWSVSHLAIPAGINFGDKVYVTLQAKRTAGTGTVRGITQMWQGDQS